VVPHEVAGFGGYTKHVSIGLGGPETIELSHFFSAVYGIKQTLGQIAAPVRQLLDLGLDRFLERAVSDVVRPHRSRSAA
jgi:nickel-dependent lactate racemase